MVSNAERITTPAQPVVLVVRDPDAATEVSIFGLPDETVVLNLDLGGSFDVSTGWGLESEVRAWVSDRRAEMNELEPEHPARVRMLEIVERVEHVFELALPD